MVMLPEPSKHQSRYNKLAQLAQLIDGFVGLLQTLAIVNTSPTFKRVAAAAGPSVTRVEPKIVKHRLQEEYRHRERQ